MPKKSLHMGEASTVEDCKHTHIHSHTHPHTHRKLVIIEVQRDR